ncbi:MAG: hypothetical protein KGL35_26820 [Bradyrhizobium sp.]|nr:hypothetical protein [Bradyrhizobium sp.]
MSLSEEDRREAERLANDLENFEEYYTVHVHRTFEFLRRLAAQPAQVPMTNGDIKRFLSTNCIYLGKSFGAMLTDGEAVEVVKFIEAHHGIGEKP